MGTPDKAPMTSLRTPYRTPPERSPTDDGHETAATGALLALVLILGVLIAQFAPRNRSDDPEPRGHGARHGGGHGSAGGHR